MTEVVERGFRFKTNVSMKELMEINKELARRIEERFCDMLAETCAQKVVFYRDMSRHYNSLEDIPSEGIAEWYRKYMADMIESIKNGAEDRVLFRTECIHTIHPGNEFEDANKVELHTAHLYWFPWGYHDYKMEICYIPYKDTILGIYVGDERYYDIIRDCPYLTDFKTYDVKPAFLSEEDWKERKESWDNAIGPDYVPGKHGLWFTLFDPGNYDLVHKICDTSLMDNALKKAYYDIQKRGSSISIYRHDEKDNMKIYTDPSDEDTVMIAEDDTIRVCLSNIGEGTCGDYNEDDPEDENLLRFDILYKDPANPDMEWTEVEDASYCTNIPANSSEKHLKIAITNIFNRYREVADLIISGCSVKKLGEELSWIG